jgi:hypothetical protein
MTRRKPAPAQEPERELAKEPVLPPVPQLETRIVGNGQRLCGWCVNRDPATGRTDQIVYPSHRPCTWERCHCACRHPARVIAAAIDVRFAADQPKSTASGDDRTVARRCDHVLCSMTGGEVCTMEAS